MITDPSSRSLYDYTNETRHAAVVQGSNKRTTRYT
jgi:hypothetical protein